VVCSILERLSNAMIDTPTANIPSIPCPLSPKNIPQTNNEQAIIKLNILLY